MVKITLAILLLAFSLAPARAMQMEVFTLEVANPQTGFIFTFFPHEDMDRETCIARLKEVQTKAPARGFCVQRVVQREFC